MDRSNRTLTDEETFKFMLSQLEEVDRIIRYQGEGHRSETKFFLSLLSALITIALGLITFNVPAEKRLIILSTSIPFFLIIFSLSFIITSIFLVLKIESRIVTYEWIERAINLRRFFLDMKHSIKEFYPLPFQIENAPKYWPKGILGHHPYFKASLFLYIILNSLFAGTIAFSISYQFTSIHEYSLLVGATVTIAFAIIEWVLCREHLINKDKQRKSTQNDSR